MPWGVARLGMPVLWVVDENGRSQPGSSVKEEINAIKNIILLMVLSCGISYISLNGGAKTSAVKR